MATKHKERFDLQTKFRSNKYVLAPSLFSAEDYGNLWITPGILILVGVMGLFHYIWTSSFVCMCVCVCVCVLETGEVWWNACWYCCTVTVFRRTYPLHWAYTVLVIVLFMFRKRKGESLHLYVSYDGYTMVEKFIPITISFPQTLKTCYLKRLQ